MSLELNVRFAGKNILETKCGNFTITTDLPAEKGGEDSAPGPFQMFCTSIATCTSYYALAFCNSHEIDTTGMRFSMHCDFDEKEQRYTRFAMELTLPEGFPEKYKQAIVRAMDKCFVKKHILNPPKFELTAV